MLKHFAVALAALLAIGGSVALSVWGGEAKAAPGDGQDLAGTLGALERQSFEAWKTGDRAFWTSFLSERFVGWGSSGRLDKTSAARAFSGADCRIVSYQLSNEQVSPLTSDAAVLTHKTEVEAYVAVRSFRRQVTPRPFMSASTGSGRRPFEPSRRSSIQ
jgi:hypothetical protein